MSDDKYKGIKLLRKRYFPNELVDISGDEILYLDDKLMVTRWKPINERDDIGGGVSFWYFKKNIKASKIYKRDGSFKYYYMDMCRYELKKNKETKEIEEVKMIDLLADVIMYDDGNYKVLDFDELSEYLENGSITPKEFMQSIKSFTKIIGDINDGVFPYAEMEKYE